MCEWRIDDAGREVFALRVDHGGAGGRVDGFADGGDLAVLYIDRAVFDVAVGHGHDDGVLDDDVVMGADCATARGIAVATQSSVGRVLLVGACVETSEGNSRKNLDCRCASRSRVNARDVPLARLPHAWDDLNVKTIAMVAAIFLMALACVARMSEESGKDRSCARGTRKDLGSRTRRT